VFLELFRVPIEGIFLEPLSLVASVFVPNKGFEYWFLTIQETKIEEPLESLKTKLTCLDHLQYNCKAVSC
jgi:hypothetical protein